jgi:predicted branched-subunit amino acid permease
VGFGALAGDAGVSFLLAVISTPLIFALPAQIIMVEMWQVGAPVAALVLAVMMANARFLPMTATLLPQMRHPRWKGWQYAFAAHCVAMSGWAIAMRRNLEMDAEHRLPFFCGFSTGMWLACVVGTVAGYFMSGMVNELVTVGLIFPAKIRTRPSGSETFVGYQRACAMVGPARQDRDPGSKIAV